MDETRTNFCCPRSIVKFQHQLLKKLEVKSKIWVILKLQITNNSMHLDQTDS